MSDTDDTLDVAAIRDAAEKATPGPWHWESEGFMGCGQVFTMGEHVMGGSIAGPTGDCYPRSGYSPMEDMQFIATMDPPTTLALLDALDAARAEVEELHTVVRMLAEAWIAADGEPATRDDLTALTTVNRLGTQLLAAINQSTAKETP